MSNDSQQGPGQQASGPRHEIWSSRLAFIFAAVGAAVGLGSLWRFPYVVGVNGGGAFIALYIFFVALLCVPIMAAEMVIGRRGGGSAIESMNKLVRGHGLSPAWRVIGWLSIFIPFMGLSYYSVVASWVMDYVGLAALNRFTGFDSADSVAMFGELTHSVPRQMLLHAGFIALTVWIVSRGVHRGIEKVAKIMMPALFAILIGLVLYNLVALDFAAGARFLFMPDFSRITTEVVLMALGQAFYSTAIGVGVMMTYSAYLPKNISLPQSAGIICGSVIFTSIMAGLAIFPIVFHFGLNPGEGPTLTFITLPVAFGNMPGGYLIGLLFFILVFFAGFTTAIGMLEPTVSWLQERFKFSRPVLTAGAGIVTWIVGLPSVLSFNALRDFHPLGWLEPFADRTAFEVIDFVIANFLLPANALLIAVFVAWALRSDISVEELGIGRGLRYRTWRFIIAVIAPLAIIGIMIDLWY